MYQFVKIVLLLVLLFSTILASDSSNNQRNLSEYVTENTKDGNYFKYILANGHTRKRRESRNNVDIYNLPVIHIQTLYSYIDPNGYTHTVNYKDGNRGFHLRRPNNFSTHNFSNGDLINYRPNDIPNATDVPNFIGGGFGGGVSFAPVSGTVVSTLCGGNVCGRKKK